MVCSSLAKPASQHDCALTSSDSKLKVLKEVRVLHTCRQHKHRKPTSECIYRFSAFQISLCCIHGTTEEAYKGMSLHILCLSQSLCVCLKSLLKHLFGRNRDIQTESKAGWSLETYKPSKRPISRPNKGTNQVGHDAKVIRMT